MTRKIIYSDTEIKKFLSAKVKESGLSLENDVSKILKKNYTVQREIPFYDKDEQTGRSFDISARKFFPDESNFKNDPQYSLAQYNLIIECKNIPGNIWVFSEDNPSGVGLPEHSSLNQNIKPDPVFNVTPYESISGIQYVSGYDEYVLDKKKSNSKTNNLFIAIMSITKATNHQKTSMDNIFEKMKSLKLKKQKYILHFAFFQPVIVFTGKIYIANFDNKGEPKFSEKKFVQMGQRYESKDYHVNAGDIHIINFDHLKEYLKMVDRYYRQNENLMIKNKTIFLKCAKLAGM